MIRLSAPSNKAQVISSMFNKRPALMKHPFKKFKNLISTQGACLDHYGILSDDEENDADVE